MCVCISIHKNDPTYILQKRKKSSKAGTVWGVLQDSCTRGFYIKDKIHDQVFLLLGE